MEETWTVGQLAAVSGVTVRTCQYYDRIGLLPARRDHAGRRRYGTAELARLQQIQLLTGVGFSLDDVAATLAARSGRSLAEVYTAQARLLELEELRTRCRRTVLAAVATVLTEHPGADVPAAAIAAVMNLDRTLLRHPDVASPAAGAAPDEETVQGVLGVYFAWKAAAVQALVLAADDVPPEDPSARRLWLEYERALLQQLHQGPEDLLDLHTEHARHSESWPADDRDLHHRTEEYLHRCQQLHATACLDRERGRS